MHIESKRLIITDFTPDMAEAVHKNSLDDDVRRFVPDEVFETAEDAAKTIGFLISRYGTDEGPFVHPVLTKAGDNIGYVQLVPAGDGWEIGYHIAKAYAGRGYASEAVSAFLPAIASKLGISQARGVCLAENAASARVMEKCGFEKVYSGAGDYLGETREILIYIWNARE